MIEIGENLTTLLMYGIFFGVIALAIWRNTR